jgi:hypothetical protein
MNIRGKYGWMASQKDLRLSGQNIAATFIALRAIAQWNHRVCKGASVGGLFHVGLTTAHRPKRGPVARSNLAGSMPLVAPTPDDAAAFEGAVGIH